MKRLYITIVITAFLAFSSYIFYREGTLPVNKNSTESKIFVIKKGESLNQIINNLSSEGLIRNRLVFYIIIKQLGLEKNIQAGDFRLSPSMDAYQIAKTLTHGSIDIWTTIIEGLRKEEIAQIISREFGIPESEFLKYAKEGYLFPDTYLIPKDATPETILKIFSDNFKAKYDNNLKKKAAKMGLTDEEVLIFASLVEKEAKYDQDRQKVASIILKRYNNGWPLQVDASIQYALGYQVLEKTWWKKYLTYDDLEIDSPYNTYKNTKLPPTPICNPGLASIEAVVNADTSTPYWYYLSDKSGHMHYARTLEEHERNKEMYLK